MTDFNIFFRNKKPRTIVSDELRGKAGPIRQLADALRAISLLGHASVASPCVFRTPDSPPVEERLAGFHGDGDNHGNHEKQCPSAWLTEFRGDQPEESTLEREVPEEGCGCRDDPNDGDKRVKYRPQHHHGPLTGLKIYAQ